jgi:hypothetical protein
MMRSSHPITYSLATPTLNISKSDCLAVSVYKHCLHFEFGGSSPPDSITTGESTNTKGNGDEDLCNTNAVRAFLGFSLGKSFYVLRQREGTSLIAIGMRPT